MEGDLDRTTEDHESNFIRSHRQPWSRVVASGAPRPYGRRVVRRSEPVLTSTGTSRGAPSARSEGPARRRSLDPRDRRALARPATALRTLADCLWTLQGVDPARRFRS